MSKIVYSKSNNVRVSPRKVRLLIDVIRGQNAEVMSQKLKFLNKSSALHVKKALDSAIANAKNNDNLDSKELKIVEAKVDQGYVLKRGKAVSKGRYHRILRRNSNITLGLSTES